MVHDTRAEILQATSETAADGSVSRLFTQIGTVYVRDRNPSAKVVLTSAREASQLEQTFDARFHSAIRAGLWLRLPGDTDPMEIVRCDDISRRRGHVLYLKRTDA